MDTSGEHKRNEAAYRRLRDSIKQTYPHSWFVAIAGEQIVGAAADFPQLENQLRTQGIDPRHAFVVEAGVDYPEYVTIFI